jgi:hypothetical protein
MVALLYVTDVPEQTGFAEAVMDMLTGKFGLTIIVTALEVAGFPLAHTAFDVSMQIMTSPLTGT